jgi:hypothetical protein
MLRRQARRADTTNPQPIVKDGKAQPFELPLNVDDGVVATIDEAHINNKHKKISTCTLGTECNNEIYVMDANGSNLQQLVHDGRQT